MESGKSSQELSRVSLISLSESVRKGPILIGCDRHINRYGGPTPLQREKGFKGEASGCFRRAKKICANSLAGEDPGLGLMKADAIVKRASR